MPLVATDFTELAPTFSPDGRWLAYSSSETGVLEVFVVPFPNTGDAKWPVSVGGGTEPLWSRDGSEIFYRNGRGQLVAAQVATVPEFSVEGTSVLFSDQSYTRTATRRQYDVSADGRRFNMIRPLADDQESELVLVQNFFEELKRVAPH